MLLPDTLTLVPPVVVASVGRPGRDKPGPCLTYTPAASGSQHELGPTVTGVDHSWDISAQSLSSSLFVCCVFKHCASKNKRV